VVRNAFLYVQGGDAPPWLHHPQLPTSSSGDGIHTGFQHQIIVAAGAS